MHKGNPVIDVHGHVSTPAQFRAHALNVLLGTPAGQNALKLPDEALAKANEEHIKCLDDRQIDIQLISPRPVAMLHFESAEVVDTWTKTTNDVICQCCGMYSKRFAGVAQLPQQSDRGTETCIPELDRCVNELGFVAAILNPDPSGNKNTPGMDKEYWFPLYARAQELKVPLIIHGSVCRCDQRIDLFDNFTFEQTLATHALERGNVFDRFPDLKIIVAHCGGAPSRLMPPGTESSGEIGGGQADSHVKYEQAVHRDVSDNLFFDTCAYDSGYLELAFKQRGAHRMLFGTEAPGIGTFVLNPDTGKPSDDLVPVIERFSFLTDEQRKDVFSENARRVIPRLAL